MNELCDTQDEVATRPSLHILFEGMARVYDHAEADELFESLEAQLKSSLAANREKDAANRRYRDNEARLIEAVSKLTLEWQTQLVRAEKAEAANREQKAEIERLTAGFEIQRRGRIRRDVQIYELTGRAEKAEAELASLRASIGEKWIDVKQELPEKSLDVYVLARFTEDFLSTPGMYNRRPAEVVSGNYVHLNTRIYTHWQPLPAPPTLPAEEK